MAIDPIKTSKAHAYNELILILLVVFLIEGDRFKYVTTKHSFITILK
jgi:hypothetical protein